MAMNIISRDTGSRQTRGLGLIRVDVPSGDDLGELDERLNHYGVRPGRTGRRSCSPTPGATPSGHHHPGGDALVKKTEFQSFNQRQLRKRATGADGPFFRVHHFKDQQSPPFLPLSAIATTARIQIGTGEIDTDTRIQWRRPKKPPPLT